MEEHRHKYNKYKHKYNMLKREVDANNVMISKKNIIYIETWCK
jgi:hypothetical protein